MGKIITNRHLIDAPRVGRMRYGLFTAAAAMLPLETRGIGAGYQWTSDHCGADVVTYDQTCAASPVKPFEEGTDTFGTDPFWVLARKRCGTVGRTAEEAQNAARVQLLTDEQRVVEEVLWSGGGLSVGPPALTLAGATVVTPGGPGAGAAIAALEGAFYAAHGYNGTIHVNTAAYAAVDYAGIVDRASGQLVTTLDSVWSFGAGYDITGPAGVAPAAGFVWAFMTPQITIWRSDVMQVDARQTLDRELNQWDTIAERVYLIGYDCQDDVFAVQVPVAAPAVATAPAVPV